MDVTRIAAITINGVNEPFLIGAAKNQNALTVATDDILGKVFVLRSNAQAFPSPVLVPVPSIVMITMFPNS